MNPYAKDDSMATPDSSRWSELSMDILRSVFERLSFVDFHRAKIVCSNWYSCSKQSVLRKSESPWLMLFPEDDGCVLYNPEEDIVYRKKRDYTGIRFLANSGNWFLVIDSRSKLYIIDVFSEKRIDLPPLESIKGGRYRLDQVGDKEFKQEFIITGEISVKPAEYLNGLLWVDENKEEYVVVWFFDISSNYLAFCNNGKDHYSEISTQIGIHRRGVHDMVLRGYSLYVLTILQYVRVLDLSGQLCFEDVYASDRLPMPPGDDETTDNIAVTTSGGVLLVRILDESSSENNMIVRLYKKDRNAELVEVVSLGDEALLMDCGITVPAADHTTLGIEPNSIYFTRLCISGLSLDICVFNLATKTFKRFPSLSNLKLEDARWFLPKVCSS